MKTPLSSMLLVLLASFLGSIAAVLLKTGADAFDQSKQKAAKWIVAGAIFFGASSVFYVMGIKEGSLTVLYPLISLGYVWTLIWSRMFLNEPFNKHKIWGLALVLTGVLIIGLGNR